MDAVAFGEAIGFAVLVLENSGEERSGDSDVKHAALAGHDVDVVAAF